MIPNGVDLPNIGHRDWRPSGKLRLLYLGRLHPIKGIENLLQAMRRIGDTTISLSIYGAGEKHYVNHLHSLVRSLGLKGSVAFMGYAGGIEKANAFMNADVCVVPSYTENFCMVVAEALSHGVPVIAGKGTPWHDLDAHDCGLWVDNSPESLAAAITHVKTAPLQTWGHNGRLWMKREFEWTSIATRMIALYRCATDGTNFQLRRAA
jgi:glycosyltransferase involved in cell wall biosynthesis